MTIAQAAQAVTAVNLTPEQKARFQEIVQQVAAIAQQKPNPKLDAEAVPPVTDKEWTERRQDKLQEDIEQKLTIYWTETKEPKHIIYLCGEGGLGKSSLVRHWLDMIDSSKNIYSSSTPDGIFWWAFGEKTNVENFFIRAIDYFTRPDFHKTLSKTEYPEYLAALLHAKRYILVLDGLETVQYQSQLEVEQAPEGRDHGFIKNEDLARFIEYYVETTDTDHRSLCLITSRHQNPNFMRLKHHVISLNSMSHSEGQELLEKMGVEGSVDQFKAVVDRWQGHTLALNLLGKYLVKKHEGNIIYEEDLLPPGKDRPSYENCWRMLEIYDQILPEEAKSCIQRFLIYFRPLHASEIISELETDPQIVKDLAERHILQHNPRSNTYTIHPLVRTYYIQQRNQAIIELLQSWTEQDKELAAEGQSSIKSSEE